MRTTIAGLGQPDTGRWGVYAAAVARWELLLGRRVPEPTQPGRHGNPVLAPPFVEWLMGLDTGHVTNPALGLPRTAALRVLGNGVVPQQAATALRLLLCPYRHELGNTSLNLRPPAQSRRPGRLRVPPNQPGVRRPRPRLPRPWAASLQR